MTWKKGTSGNIAGRPVGTGHVAQLRAALAAHLPEVISAVLEAAKKGDTAAAKLVLERVIPALRHEEMSVALGELSGSRAEMVESVIRALAAGEIDVDRGTRIISAVRPSELESRIAALEAAVKTEGGEP